MEDYKNKYGDLLDMIKELYPNMTEYQQEKLQGVCPELAENEDEKIRKELIEYHKIQASCGGHNAPFHEKYVSWLEKQGSIGNINEKLRQYRKYLVKETERWHKNEEDETLSKISKQDCIGHANAYISARSEFEDLFNYDSCLEKQNEQKETLCDKCRREQPSHSCQDITELGRCALKHQSKQKPEPKFKVGDWVVSNITNKTYKINSIDAKDANYIIYSCVPSVYTDEDSPCFSESMIRLWTIENAKNGDVLKEDSCIFIIEKMNPNGSAIVHCCLFDDGNFDLTGSTLHFDIDSAHPATKEQRDTLMKAMTDVGYTFNFDKKELKKIEQNPDELSKGEENSTEFKSTCCHNDGLYYAIDILETTLGKVEGYQSDDGILEHKAAIEAVKKMKIQEPAIKPIFEVGDVMRTVDEAAKNVTGGLPVVVSIDKKYYKCNNELIAIKDQYDYEYPPINKQQKPIEWSEEDEKMLNTVILHVKEYQKIVNPANETGESNITDWLKSLKPRPHWKPSEEQLVALWKIIPNIVNSEEDVDTITELSILYENLKKL
jgi:hypothetical protein